MRRVLLWFKQDLRLDDHPALQAALDAERVLPLYVFDPALLQPGPLGCRRLGVHRARFLLESLAALDGELRQRGSGLLVMQGNARQLIPALVEQLGLDEVLTLEEIVPAERSRLDALRQALGAVPLHELPGDDLLQPADLPCPPDELPPTFSAFRACIEQRLPVFQPHPAPQRLAPLPDNAGAYFSDLPSLSRLGLGEPLSVANSAFPFSGGEPAAQARLRDYLWLSQEVRRYSETRHGMIGTEYSSKLSPWLANGSLSARRLVAELRRHEAQYGQNDSTHELWHSVLRREFFRQTLRRHGRALFRHAGLRATAQAPCQLDRRFEQWCLGRTGMPLVDACMRELAATGFLSSRGRQIAASYLIGDLQQDWRHGAAWFEEHLLDHDPASNWGNWACLVALAGNPRQREQANALLQARRCDPEAVYVSMWLPELRDVPRPLRHTPFLLSHAQLDALGYPCLERIPDAWKPYLAQAA